MPKYENIFDNESGEEDGFRINENYAARYDRWRSKEELEKLKARGTILPSSEEESSDEEPGDKDFGKPNNPEFDREFLLSLGTIYKHEKGDIDLKDVQFFEGDYRLEKEKEEKPMTLKDFERHVMVEREGKFEENEIDTRNSDVILKDAKKVKLDDGLDESDGDGDGDDLFSSGLFKVKEDSNKGLKEDINEAPENEAVDFVKGVNDSLSDTKNKDLLETVKDKWNNEKLSKKDKWLVDFFLNKRYMAGGSDDEGYCNESFLDEEELSEEETTEDLDPLATQYKFRHQEPGDFIKRHPRSVPESLRQKDERRKERREATKQRQVMKKEEKRKEIELLKILKYKEIEEKIDKIKEASGNEDIDLGEIDLEADFDPDAHDAYMERVIGDNYYDDCNAEEEIPDFGEEKDDTKIYDNWTQASTSNEADEENWEENYYDDYNMDADNDEQNAEGVEKKTVKSSTRRKNRHQSKFARALEKKKPLFDPNEKDFASYFDEYYQLDFEDVIGGMPCRFKYRKVESNNFGLTTGEILAAQNTDLNKWVGLKKIMQYDRSKELEVKERQMYGDRAKHIHIKQKILPSLFDENPEDLAEREREKRRMRNLKKKQKKWKLRDGIADDAGNPAAPEGTDVSDTIKEGEIKNEKKRPLEGSDENFPKRKQHKLEEETETLKQPTFPEDNGRKKKKKKHKQDIVAQEDTTSIKKKNENTTDDTVEPVDIEGEVIMKKKKKKKNQMEDTPNTPAPEIHETERDVTTDQVDIEEEDVVMKKKKKKKTKDHIQDAPSEGKIVKEKRKKKKKHGEQTKDIQSKPTKNSRSRKIKRKNYHGKHNKSIPYLQGISDARLEAYGQNPKKLKNRVIYGKEF